jgi:hypothetical protein
MLRITLIKVWRGSQPPELVAVAATLAASLFRDSCVINATVSDLLSSYRFLCVKRYISSLASVLTKIPFWERNHMFHGHDVTGSTTSGVQISGSATCWHLGWFRI